MSANRSTRSGGPGTANPIPATAGIGLRTEHVRDFAGNRLDAGWIEVHSENYLGDGGPRLRALDAIREDYPLSCHGVALSLGSADGLDADMLDRLVAMFARFEPELVSEHVAWSIVDGIYLNDLLPIPYTEEALGIMCRNIETAQEAFARPILMENPSSYARFVESDIPEWEFMAALSQRSGCGILLDVNNVYVSACNHGFDPEAYLDAIPAEAVGEIHVAGHTRWSVGEETVLIDTHNDYVCDDVWTLLERALERFGPKPVLVEWDSRLPPVEELLAERQRAQARIDAVGATLGHVA